MARVVKWQTDWSALLGSVSKAVLFLLLHQSFCCIHLSHSVFFT